MTINCQNLPDSVNLNFSKNNKQSCSPANIVNSPWNGFVLKNRSKTLCSFVFPLSQYAYAIEIWYKSVSNACTMLFWCSPAQLEAILTTSKKFWLPSYQIPNHITFHVQASEATQNAGAKFVFIGRLEKLLWDYPLCDYFAYIIHAQSLYNCNQKSPSPRPMANRAAPISASLALGHAFANAVKATAGGWSTGSSASLTFPLHSHVSSARREGSENHF